MHGIATKIGDSLCRALSIGGCEYSHTINALGYAAVIMPVVALSLLLMRRSHY